MLDRTPIVPNVCRVNYVPRGPVNTYFLQLKALRGCLPWIEEMLFRRFNAGRMHTLPIYIFFLKYPCSIYFLFFLISELNSSHSFPHSSSLDHRTTVWHMQNWSWSDRGQSPRPPPALTPLPPAQTLCTLRSSSRKNSCKHSSSGHMDVMVPPGEGDWTEWQPKDYIYELSVWHLAFIFWL